MIELKSGNATLLFNELSERLKRFRQLHFKAKSIKKDIKVYLVNDKYRPVLSLSVWNEYDAFKNKTTLNYLFKIDDVEFVHLVAKNKDGKDWNFIKTFFLDFYEFLLSTTEIEEFFNVKNVFLEFKKRWM